ncbi:cytochrome b562 [Marinomonas atlantica]|uniref:cytochrome b562 n=1 Tax=Marinomonas atlantica TaxID=1806668 RepID=UPI000829BCDB|nr:cytochrome b562 [Marinomonas atlantica]MCO4786784.1 hypothetical protein [Marinomonas atlantica]
MLSKKALLGGLIMSVGAVSFSYADCDGTALHDNMGSLKTEMKSLAFDVKKENFASADQRIDTIIAVLKEAREETPYLFVEKGLSGDKLAARKADYQSVIDETITAFMALDGALEAKDSSKAKTMLGEIGKLRKKGHRAFKTDC